jgi:hypothetical protein
LPKARFFSAGLGGGPGIALQTQLEVASIPSRDIAAPVSNIKVRHVICAAPTHRQKMVNRQPHRMQAIKAKVNLAPADVAFGAPQGDQFLPRNRDLPSRTSLVVLLRVVPTASSIYTWRTVGSAACSARAHQIMAAKAMLEGHRAFAVYPRIYAVVLFALAPILQILSAFVVARLFACMSSCKRASASHARRDDGNYVRPSSCPVVLVSASARAEPTAAAKWHECSRTNIASPMLRIPNLAAWSLVS